MTDQYTYQKKRKEFGRHAQFEDTETKIVGSVIPNADTESNYIQRNPNKIILDNIPQMTEHRVNTERVATQNQGMKHVVGGWPKEYDYTEATDVQKYNKRLMRDPILGYAVGVQNLVNGAQKCIRQNNEIDLFEEYFLGEQGEHLAENITTKTVMIFKDPNEIKRSVTKINWHPDHTLDLRVGVAYSQLRFQQMPPNMPKDSYIWNLNNPNNPEKTLSCPSPLCTLKFNHKNSDIVVGGSYNGSLSFFDLKKGDASGVVKPIETTILEKSHHDPVYDIYWLTVQKTGTECVSTSTDGRLLWWDMRKLSEGPIDHMTLEEKLPGTDGEPTTKILGGTSLEYLSEAGPLKYLMGTEQGQIFMVNRRKNIEVNFRFGLKGGKHHGPVYALQRNPAHNKFFLSVGDWSAKIWSEDLQTPIMQTRYHTSYLTDGCWSPTRPGLFYLTRADGFLDVWDFFYRQNEVAYSQKVSDHPLTSISVQGQMSAVGDADGTVHMMSLCRTLYDQTLQPREKEIMLTIFEREARREKNLENAKRLAEKEKPADKKNAAQEEQKRVEKLKKQLDDITTNFYEQVADDEEHLQEIKERAEQQRIQQDEKQQDRSDTPAREFLEGQSYDFEINFDVEGKQVKRSISFAIKAGGEIQQTAGQIQFTGSATGTRIILKLTEGDVRLSITAEAQFGKTVRAQGKFETESAAINQEIGQHGKVYLESL